MLEHLIEQQDAVSVALTKLKGLPKNLSAHQWSTSRKLVAALRSFLDVTEMMCSAQNPTMSMILPVLDGLTHNLRRTVGGLNGVRTNFLQEIEDRWGEFHSSEDLCVATLVDPRYKLISFDTDMQREAAIDYTILAMERVAQKTKRVTQVTQPSCVPSTSASVTASAAAPAKWSVWEKLNTAVTTCSIDTVAPLSRQALRHEVDMYLKLTVINRSCCALVW